jgi:hypothetical protein
LAGYAVKKGYTPMVIDNYWVPSEGAYYFDSEVIKNANVVFWVKEWGLNKIVKKAQELGKRTVLVPLEDVFACPVCDGTGEVCGLDCPECTNYKNVD